VTTSLLQLFFVYKLKLFIAGIEYTIFVAMFSYQTQDESLYLFDCTTNGLKEINLNYGKLKEKKIPNI
jgi:hypothetical protein